MATAKKSAATKPAAKKSAAKSAAASKSSAKSASAKKTSSSPVAKKAAGKTSAKAAKSKSASPRAPNAAFMKPLTPSEPLAAVVGAAPLPRTEVTKKVWDYIKKNNLQDETNKRNINADDKLKVVFGGKKQVSMFEMTKLISGHLK
jgi:upstream activation factor subunit UAF30